MIEVESGGPGAFRRAGKATGFYPSSINVAVDKVEEFLGCHLLAAGPLGRRKCQLTPFGARFKFGATAVLAEWEKTLNDIKLVAAQQ